MKKQVFLFLVLGFLYSCDKDDDKSTDKGLIGNWKLIEVLADPGDGSGTFTVVESNKIITFQQNGIITSNGTLCNMSLDANNPTSGTYSLTDMTFKSPDCNNPDYKYQFKQNGNILIITYPCFEACQAKYQKE